MQNNTELTVPTEFTATLTMLSDWHIGSGAGRPGDVDRLVLRDQDGFPYVPAKTLTGIWRDACEQVALGLDNGEEGVWSEWVNYLFGDQPAIPLPRATETAPRHAALSVRSANVSDPLKRVLKREPILQNTLAFVKPGISIDPNTGSARENFLRFEEMVRGGTVLQASCELNLAELENSEEQRAVYALLVAGTRLVERIGGKRRRGAGQCKLEVEPNIKPWIDWLAQHAEHSPLPPSLPESGFTLDTQETPAITSDNTWFCLKLILTTQSPLTLAARTVGNVVETLDYIPGTYLLRIIIKKLSALGMDWNALNQAVAQADLLVTNATIAIQEQAGHPTPLAWFYEKLGGGLDKGKGVYNRLQEKEPDRIQLKGYRGGYICAAETDHLPEYSKPTTLLETHNTVQDEVQRPTSEVGGVYSYEAIEPGTTLCAELRLHRGIVNLLKQHQTDWWTVFSGSSRIGQSKKDDYGLVEITVEPPIEIQSSKPPDKQESLVVWLLSDVLLRDDRLRPTTRLEDFKQALEKALSDEQKSVQLVLGNVASKDFIDAIVRSHRLDSWQVRWGLPRPSLVGLAAGSCMVFRVTQGTLDPDKMAKLEICGIGERRAEGYGQLCCNPPLLMKPISEWNRESQENAKQSSISSQEEPRSITLLTSADPAYDYAKVIEREAWREAIRRASLYLASHETTRKRLLGLQMIEDGNQKRSKPSMSQLGALRSVLGKLQEPNDAEVITWLNHVKEKQGDQWKDSQSQTSGLDKITDLIKERLTIWNHLSNALEKLNHPTFVNLILTQDGEILLQEELWAEAIQTLVATCIRAHKRETEEESEKD